MQTHIDRGIFLAVIFLIGLGLVQVYSSGYIFAIERYDDGLFFVRRQMAFAFLGILALLIFSYMPVRILDKVVPLMFLAGFMGIVATFVPGIGVKVGGAHRWLNMPFGLRFEPSELLKITFPLVVARLLTYDFKSPDVKSKSAFWRSFFWFCALMPLAFVLKQPDFGTFAICAVVFFSLSFAQGLKWRYVTALAALGAAVFYFLIMNEGYRRARLVAFLNPWADPEQKGFQVIQSLLSFYSGGLTGNGLGQGQGKLFFLPEAHTDFTLAVLGEEIGFIGVLGVLLVFSFLIFRGLQVAVHCKTPYQQLAVAGLTLNLALSTFINAGVAMGLLPTKGLAMPFLSYGGSSLLCTCIAIGMILNFERQSRQQAQIARKNFSGYRIQ